MQKGVYTYERSILPPMPRVKNYSTVSAKPPPAITKVPLPQWPDLSASTPSSSDSPSPPSSQGTRITVNTVVVRKPLPQPQQPITLTSVMPKQHIKSPTKPPPTVKALAEPSTSSSPSNKKDPLAGLFLPKRRAFSQLPASSRPAAR